MSTFPPVIICVCIDCPCYLGIVANFSRYKSTTLKHTHKITPPTSMFAVQNDFVQYILHGNIGFLNLVLECRSVLSNSVIEYNVLSRVHAKQVVLNRNYL